jgi:transcriptional regulator with XRE-family HTH domain
MLMNGYEFNLDMYKLVARNVNKYMKLKNLTTESLAQFTEISEKFLDKFLNNNDNTAISIYDLYKISVILEVGMNVFFEE